MKYRSKMTLVDFAALLSFGSLDTPLPGQDLCFRLPVEMLEEQKFGSDDSDYDVLQALLCAAGVFAHALLVQGGGHIAIPEGDDTRNALKIWLDELKSALDNSVKLTEGDACPHCKRLELNAGKLEPINLFDINGEYAACSKDEYLRCPQCGAIYKERV